MRSLTMFVVAAVVVMISGIASAQEVSHRLTADVFAEAGFPAEIIEAAKTADEVARRTKENGAMAKQDLGLIESIFDRAVFMPQIPLELFEKLQWMYEAALQRFWNTDQEIRQADSIVTYLYFNWCTTQGEGGSDTKLAQVFQEWQTASRSSYLTLSEEEAGAYRLMIGIGRARIMTGYHERSRNPWSRPAPLTMWRVKNDE